MILLAAIAAGLVTGLLLARWRRHPYQAPDLKHAWLVFVAFMPQFAAFYLPGSRHLFSEFWAAFLLPFSQALLLMFAWLNRRLPGMMILLLGAALNFTVIAANRGFMPISPQTASHLVPQAVLENIQPGERFGTKDILLLPQDTRFEWLACQMQAEFNKDIAENLNLKFRYLMFANYETLDLQTIDHRLDIGLTAKVNRFMNVTLGGILIYDYDQDSGVQLAEAFSLGISYSFQNFEEKK